jgi:hypothetical protein
MTKGAAYIEGEGNYEINILTPLLPISVILLVATSQIANASIIVVGTVSRSYDQTNLTGAGAGIDTAINNTYLMLFDYGQLYGQGIPTSYSDSTQILSYDPKNDNSEGFVDSVTVSTPDNKNANQEVISITYNGELDLNFQSYTYSYSSAGIGLLTDYSYNFLSIKDPTITTNTAPDIYTLIDNALQDGSAVEAESYTYSIDPATNKVIYDTEVQANITSVYLAPEPTSIALLTAGLLGLFTARRKATQA